MSAIITDTLSPQFFECKHQVALECSDAKIKSIFDFLQNGEQAQGFFFFDKKRLIKEGKFRVTIARTNLSAMTTISYPTFECVFTFSDESTAVAVKLNFG